MNGQQIEQFMKCFKYGIQFGGVYCADNLPEPKKNFAYIVNTDNCGSIGTHWVAFYFPSGELPEYFDSSGYPAMNSNFLNFLGNQSYLFNNIKIQPFDSHSCGFYCIYYICERLKGKTPFSIVSVFDEVNKKK